MFVRLATTPHLIAASFCCAVSAVAADERADPRRSYDLPRGDAATTLRQFADACGRQIFFMMDKVTGVQTNAIVGVYTPREAIDRMLAGTSLVAHQDDETGGFVVSRRLSPAPREEVGSKPNTMNPKTLPAKLRALLAHGSLAIASIVAAQQPENSPENKKPEEAIVLDTFTVNATGTQIRGVEPVGTNSIHMDMDAIKITGAANTNDILARTPQISNLFNQVPTQQVGNLGAAVVYPLIRNLGASGNSTTLVLMNGHRLVGSGATVTTPDATIVPPMLLEAVDIVPDGASAIFGSDAVAGVINFITRKSLDGTLISAHYGFRSGYSTKDFDVAHGFNWKGGSAIVSYSFADHTALFNKDLSFATGGNNMPEGGTEQRPLTGSPGNIVVSGVSYKMDTRTSGVNRSNNYKDVSVYPKETRNTFFASAQQKIGETVSASIEGYWSERDTNTYMAQQTFNQSITSANPYFNPIGAETSHTVQGNLSAAFGPTRPSRGLFTSMGVTAELTFKLPGDWQVRMPVTYGTSYNTIHGNANADQSALSAALSGTTTATALNPYNVAATDAAVLAAINNYEVYVRGVQNLSSFQAIADGTIYTGPGGKVKMAVGVESGYYGIDVYNTTGRIGSTDNLARGIASRSIRSAFAELNIPLVGRDNRAPGIEALTLSVSGRIDNYSDFGETRNPMLGFTYKPLADLKIRANYGTSFNAPSLADTIAGAVDTRAQNLGSSPWIRAGDDPANSSRPTILLAGGSAGLKPQRARTYSTGFDWTPKALDGLTVSATYYHVKFLDQITVVPFFNPVLFADPALSKYYIINPTQAEATAFIGGLRLDGFSSVADLYNTGRAPYLITAAQRVNFGRMELGGVDFQVSYKVNTKYGSFNAFIGGTKQLQRDQVVSETQPTVDLLPTNLQKLAYSVGLGAHVGRLNGQITMYYGDGYTATGIPGQTRVGSFAPVNLFFGYDIKGRGLLEDTSVTLNIDNVFDKAPPFANNATGYTNGMTLGRIVQIGFRKQF